MTDYALEAIAAITNVNITAPSLLVQSALPALRDSQGVIVNISTVLTNGSVPMQAHYATKAASHLGISQRILRHDETSGLLEAPTPEMVD